MLIFLRYDIVGVMGPDEYHGTTDNNVYTNVVAGMAIYFSKFAACAMRCDDVPDEWMEVARRLSLQYDKDLDYHPQYEGYQPGTKIKQADTVLIGYPLMYEMNHTTRKNDLEMYEAVTDMAGPAMTWGMHAVGHLELGETDKASMLFKRSYEPYVHKPFYMWTENIMGAGAVNFITGMGGVLQGGIFGYLGLRTRLDRMDFNPNLPPDCSQLNVTGINFHGAVFNIIVADNTVTIQIKDVGKGLLLQNEEGGFELFPGDEYGLPKKAFTIIPLNVEYLSLIHI